MTSTNQTSTNQTSTNQTSTNQARSQSGPAVALTLHEGRGLEVTFPSGDKLVLDADRLRQSCRCAHCRRARIDGTFCRAEGPVLISSYATIGHYGVNIAFSDGHARGIYPWGFLAELASL